MRALFSKKLIAISKPRCASTSLRRLLDPFVDPEAGDIAVDVAGRLPPYHPHHSAPYLKYLLRQDGHNLTGMKTIVVSRHPVEMLWSYFKYFKPDIEGKYTYQDTWLEDAPMSFEDWLLTGRVGMNPMMLEMAPDWISTNDLSPLSLEAHSENVHGESEVDLVFRAERLDKLAVWLSNWLGTSVTLPHVNSSTSASSPAISPEARVRVRQCFPKESEMYQL